MSMRSIEITGIRDGLASVVSAARYMIRPSLWLALSIMALCSVPALAAASGYPDSSLLATYDWLHSRTGSGVVQIVDVRQPNQYQMLHIPGAVNIPFSSLRTSDNGPLTAADYARIFGAHGIHPGGAVVVYGDPGSFDVTYTLWALNYIGLENTRAFFGGIESWVGHGGSIARGTGHKEGNQFQYRTDKSVRETTTELQRAINTHSVIPVDARTTAEFDGNDIRALRGGHIPTAINIDYTRIYKNDDPQTASLKSPALLSKLFGNLNTNSHYVTYCQTGVRASMMYFALRLMGFRHVSLYPESWQVWGSSSALPTADTSYINIPSITGSIAATDGRVDSLESLVGKMVAQDSGSNSQSSGVRPGLIFGAYILAGLALLVGIASIVRRSGH